MNTNTPAATGAPLMRRALKAVSAATKHGNTIRPEVLCAAVRYIHCEQIGDELTIMAFEAAVRTGVPVAERQALSQLIEAQRSGESRMRVLSITLLPADVAAMEAQMRERQERA